MQAPKQIDIAGANKKASAAWVRFFEYLQSLAVHDVFVSVDFGASFTDKAQAIVTGQPWVTSTSKIIPQVLTPAGADPDEMYLLDIKVVISDIVNGVGFTVTLYSQPEAKGVYSVMCLGV